MQIKYVAITAVVLLTAAFPANAEGLCDYIERKTITAGVTNVKTPTIISASSEDAVSADYKNDELVNAGTFSEGIYDVVVVPVEVELLERYNIDVPQGVDLDPIVANLEIHQNGHVTYNNQDVTQQIKKACVSSNTTVINGDIQNAPAKQKSMNTDQNTPAQLISEEVVSQTSEFQNKKPDGDKAIDGQYPTP